MSNQPAIKVSKGNLSNLSTRVADALDRRSSWFLAAVAAVGPCHGNAGGFNAIGRGALLHGHGQEPAVVGFAPDGGFAVFIEREIDDLVAEIDGDEPSLDRVDAAGGGEGRAAYEHQGEGDGDDARPRRAGRIVPIVKILHESVLQFGVVGPSGPGI